MEKGFLKDLLRSDQTIYSFKELSLLWPNVSSPAIRSRVSYYIKEKDLYPLRRGLYAKDKNYNRLELATKILAPSYVSFETVLAPAGIIFQYYGQIFVASYQTRDVICDGQTYAFKQIKRSILTNTLGIIRNEHYSIATPERAFLDILYLNPHYYFDNLTPLNWNKVYDILPIYQNNKRMSKTVNRYHESVKKGA